MKKISKYQIFFELQHGPITHVYKAFQLELQRSVLVKQLNPERIADKELVERFRQEGLILAQINSPHVITVFDFGFDNGVPFLVTEFIEGITLAELIQMRNGLPWDIALYILQQLAQGLMALHHHNIIHRDVKPDNIFISNEGDVKLGDLGFSAPLESVDQSIQGTPAYLAPEIVIGEPVDFRSDLYSLGLVGYEMMTGQNPFAADSITTVLNRIINLAVIPIHKVKPDVPVELSQLIAKLMARQPRERFQTGKDFFLAIDQWRIANAINITQDRLINFIENPDQYQSVSCNQKKSVALPSKKIKRHHVPALAFTALMVLIVLFLIGKQLTNDVTLSPAISDANNSAQPGQMSSQKGSDTIVAVSERQRKQREQSQQISGLPEATSGTMRDSADTFKTVLSEGAPTDTVLIITDPRAMVSRHGSSLGITPVKIAVDARDPVLDLEFRSPGFPVIHKSVNFTDPGAQNIHINLWKEVGYFEIDIIPWAVVWIDGDSIDVTPLNRPIILSPGNHKLMVRHPTLKSIIEPFYIVAGETLKKSILLQRAP